MARPLQRKKARSSLPKVRQKHSSRKNPKLLNINSNAIVAANWDRKLTLAQNYRRLGLSAKLNSKSGGAEAVLADDQVAGDDVDMGTAQKTRRAAKEDTFVVRSQKMRVGTAITTQNEENVFGAERVEVVRDPKTGAITRVVRPDEPSTSTTNPSPLNDPLNTIEDVQDAPRVSKSRSKSHGIISQLEDEARLSAKPKRARQQSAREQEWIELLIQKYGVDDTAAMMRDRKLNPMQQSEGELRKRIRIWTERSQKQG